MKRIILSIAFLATALANAQVGINQENPKATLDIRGKTNNTSNKVEGLLIPRVSKNKALLMGQNTTAPEESTMVYVNDLSTTTSDPKVAEITEKGYYFWNGTKWVKTISSNLSDIHFLQLANSGVSDSRFVMVDSNGKLVAGSSTSTVGLWSPDTNQNLVKLSTTSNGNPRTQNNRVTISDFGEITAQRYTAYNGFNAFPDYVFQKYYTGESSIKEDYTFNTLEQVESFIKANGHLPGYTSAKEIAEKGLIDIGATQLTNVEKIEELYLHTIEQEKELKAKDAEIKELRARLDRIESLLNK